MYLIIANPKAGGGMFARIEKRLKGLLDKQNIKYTIETVKDLNDVKALIAEYKDKKLQGIVALGGNSTVNSVLNNMPKTQIPFGMIPVSRSNTLASTLGITSWQQAARLLKRDPDIHPVGLGQIGERFFAGALKVLPKKNLLSYKVTQTTFLDRFLALLGVQKAFNTSAVKTQVVMDNRLTLVGEIKEMDITLLSTDDGQRLLMSVTAVKQEGYKLKEHTTRLKAQKMEIESELSLLVMIGNETVANTPATIKALQKTLPLIVPARQKA